MWSASFLPNMNHVGVSPTNGNGPTQGQRKTLTRVGIEPTTFGLDHRCSTDWATSSDGSRPWELKMLKSRQWTCTSTRKDYVFANVGKGLSKRILYKVNKTEYSRNTSDSAKLESNEISLLVGYSCILPELGPGSQRIWNPLKNKRSFD